MSSNDLLSLLWRRKGALAFVFVVCCAIHFLLLQSRADYYASDALVQVRERDSKPGADSLAGAQIYERFTRELLERLVEAPGFSLAAKAALREAGDERFTPHWKASSLRIEREAGSDFHRISYMSEAPDHVAPSLRASLEALREMAQNYFEQGLSRARGRLQEQLERRTRELEGVEAALTEIRRESGLEIVVGVEEQVAVLAESIETLDLRCLELGSERAALRGKLGTSPRLLDERSKRSRIVSALAGTPLQSILDDVTQRLMSAELRWARAEEELTEAHPEFARAHTELAKERRVYDSFFAEDSPFATQIEEALLEQERRGEVDPNDALSARLEGLEGQLADTEALRERKRSELATLQNLQRKIEELSERRSHLAQKANDLEATLGQVELYANLAPEVVQVFRMPSAPYYLGDELPLSLTLVLLFAILTSLAVAYFLEYLDHRIHNQEVLEKSSGIPVLGTMAWERGGGYPRTSAQGARVEELNTILKKVMVNLPRPAVVMITGCEQGAGKSTLSFQLAQRAGQFGLKTLVVDADLRAPSAASHYGLGESPGLSEALQGELPEERSPLGAQGTRVAASEVPLELAHQHVALLDTPRDRFGPVVRGTAHDNVWVVTAGAKVEDPAVTLSSSRFPELLRHGRRRFDLCIVDSPPLPVASDALLMGPHVDGTVLVVRAGRTTTHALHWVRRQLSDIGVPILGAVLNGLRKQARNYYHYSSPGGGNHGEE